MALETDKFVIHGSVNQEQFPGMDIVLQIRKSWAHSLYISLLSASITAQFLFQSELEPIRWCVSLCGYIQFAGNLPKYRLVLDVHMAICCG